MRFNSYLLHNIKFISYVKIIRLNTNIKLYSTTRPLYSSNNNQIITRKILSPLIKLIHPDLFTNETSEIQATNLKCLQIINEMWDSIEKIQESFVDNLQTKQNKIIMNPLKSKYNLVGYVRISNNNNNDNDTINVDISKIEIELLPNSVICKRNGSINLKSFNDSIINILIQLGSFFDHLGNDNPYKIINNDNLNDNNNNNNNNVFDFSKFQYQELDQKIFDRTQSKLHRLKISNSIKIFNSNSYQTSSKSQHMKKTTGNLSQRYSISKEFLYSEVDIFIRSGNILILNLSPKEEFESIQKIRDFIAEYGPILNFSFTKWFEIVIILYDGIISNNENPENNNIKNNKKIKKLNAYKYQEKDNRCLLTIPYNFKDVLLLEFIRDKVPFHIINIT